MKLNLVGISAWLFCRTGKMAGKDVFSTFLFTETIIHAVCI